MRRTSAIFLFLGTLVMCGRAHAQEIMIVANPATSVSEISRDQLRDIFTGVRNRFGDGSRAVPVLLKGGPVHEVFLSRIVGNNPDEFRVRWRRAVFTGQGSMPKEFQSEAALLDYVATTPGAIGYVSRVPDLNAVKVLTVSMKR
jgi:ABC-type phosphate transport system substrate-binding protein